MSDAEDKAFKLGRLPTPYFPFFFVDLMHAEALRGGPITDDLQQWLDIYKPRSAPKPPGYVAGAHVRERVRLRSEACQSRFKILHRIELTQKQSWLKRSSNSMCARHRSFKDPLGTLRVAQSESVFAGVK
jgi:hypothetical protein